MLCHSIIQVNRESSNLQFTVYHKHVTEFEFRKMSVGDNRTVTLQDVLLGEEYEVRVSSVEVSTGKISPLSRRLAIGEKDVTLMFICVYVFVCMCM